MNLIHWLKFLFLIFSLLSSYYIFLTTFCFCLLFVFIYDPVFRIYELHSYKVEEYSVLVVFPFLSLFLFRLFFFLSSFSLISLPFIFFPHFPIVLFFPFLIFLFFFLFPCNLHYFLNLVCHFLRAPLPCSRTFCCPVKESDSHI